MNDESTFRPYAQFPSEVHHGKVIDAYFGEKTAPASTYRLPDGTKTVFVCFSNRCGSTYFASILSQIGLFGSPNEKLNYEFLNGGDLIECCNANRIDTFLDYIAFIKTSYQSTTPYFSSKISIDQLSWLCRTKKMNIFPEPSFIFIERRNIVAQAISMEIAMQSGRWTSLHAQRPVELTYNAQNILNRVNAVANTNKFFRMFFDLHNIDPLRIVYEDYVGRPEMFIQALEPRFGSGLRIIRDSTLPVHKQSKQINQDWEAEFRGNYVVQS